MLCDVHARQLRRYLCKRGGRTRGRGIERGEERGGGEGGGGLRRGIEKGGGRGIEKGN